MPDDAEVWGLLALMHMHDARRAARVDSRGRYVPLDAQDRALWDQDRIGEGLAKLERAVRLRRPGEYQLQAAITALQIQAPDAEATDRAHVAELYGALARLNPSPVVELNRAVAVGLASGPTAGLVLLEPLLADPGCRALSTAARGARRAAAPCGRRRWCHARLPAGDRAHRQYRRARGARTAFGRAPLTDLRNPSKSPSLLRRLVRPPNPAATSTRRTSWTWNCRARPPSSRAAARASASPSCAPRSPRACGS